MRRSMSVIRGLVAASRGPVKGIGNAQLRRKAFYAARSRAFELCVDGRWRRAMRGATGDGCLPQIRCLGRRIWHIGRQ
jgi:hypothetical protein